MARKPRDYRIEKRDARLKLSPQHDPYWRSITEGLAIGYRRSKDGDGTWIVRRRLELTPGIRTYQKKRLGLADDFKPADGARVLDYGQALEKAWSFDDTTIETEHGITVRGAYTVSQAFEDYLKWFKANRSSLDRTESVIRNVIIPRWQNMAVSDLTTHQIEAWLRELVNTPTRRGADKTGEKTVELKTPKPGDSEYPEFLRRRQQTANRIYSIFRAGLNRGWRKGKITNRDAWLRVEPFRKVSASRKRFLSEAEIKLLLNACEPCFKNLVIAAISTGCRMGELAALKVSDYDQGSGTIHIRRSKTGTQRHIPLTIEGQQFFLNLTAGRQRDDVMLLKPNGKPWARWEQKWPLIRATKAAKIETLSFHALRHSYASLLAKAGAPLQVIAQSLGHTSTRMCEQHYAHLSDSYFSETIREKLPAFGIAPGNVVSIAAGTKIKSKKS